MQKRKSFDDQACIPDNFGIDIHNVYDGHHE